jgi:hypothetical protein
MTAPARPDLAELRQLSHDLVGNVTVTSEQMVDLLDWIEALERMLRVARDSVLTARILATDAGNRDLSALQTIKLEKIDALLSPSCSPEPPK